MSTNTLSSLAILKVNIDQGKDYLDYLRPFILQVLVDHQTKSITDNEVSKYICKHFGLKIPERTVHIVLQRFSREHYLKKDHGVYSISDNLPDPQITTKQADAERHIAAVIEGLRQFSQNTTKPIYSDKIAIDTICAFLNKFDITCLRAYLQGTAIPPIGEVKQTDIVRVSNYVQHLQQTNPERFQSFLILVQGHMLANALLCPDLHNAPRTYREVSFYLDTPLLIHRLGLEGEVKQTAMCELIGLLSNLKGKVSVFSHSCEELKNVLQGAAAYLEKPDGRGGIIREARMQGVTRSDLLLIAESIDDKLREAGIEVEVTPQYKEKFQIDETIFDQVLEDEVKSYYNPNAKNYDINSVRSIYAIRKNRPALSLEKSRAVLVTSNTAFARAAYEYGKKHESSCDVSSVISDFSLANIAWLKAPMGAPSIPVTQLLAFSYAAVQPSTELLGKFLRKIDKLREQGTIPESDHQLLRSSPLVIPELMRLTLGEDASLTTETVTETLERISSDIRKKESEKLTVEQKAHQETQEALAIQQTRNQEIQSKLYWRCRAKAKFLAWVFSVGVAIMLVFGLLAGIGLRSTTPILSLVLIWGTSVVALMTAANLVFGTNLRRIHEWTQNHCLKWLLKREANSIGVELVKFGEPKDQQ